MNIPNAVISFEKPEDQSAIEALTASAFGPGRFTRTAFRLREDIDSEPDLSFCCRVEKELVGGVKLTKILIGGNPALLLGPLVVAPEYKNKGVGAALMERAVTEAKNTDYQCIILVGDLPYYERFGFSQLRPKQVVMPGPVDPARLLVCMIADNGADKVSGVAEKWRETASLF